jgi:triosephosphate isomerase
MSMLIAGNWKLAKGPRETLDFCRAFSPPGGIDVVVAPPFTSLREAVSSGLVTYAQNVHWEREGAFTGEVSAEMLLELGVAGAIVGHSERRQYFGETDDTVNRKLKAALDAGLAPIVCVGEVLEEREASLTEDVLRRQCARAFRAISGERAAALVVAYEPVWAIGTGKTATPQMASEAHAIIRAEAAKAFGAEMAAGLRILYGGSVKPENAKALMSEEEIDGALVGGASLKPDSFWAIVNY